MNGFILESDKYSLDLACNSLIIFESKKFVLRD